MFQPLPQKFRHYIRRELKDAFPIQQFSPGIRFRTAPHCPEHGIIFSLIIYDIFTDNLPAIFPQPAAHLPNLGLRLKHQLLHSFQNFFSFCQYPLCQVSSHAGDQHCIRLPRLQGRKPVGQPRFYVSLNPCLPDMLLRPFKRSPVDIHGYGGWNLSLPVKTKGNISMICPHICQAAAYCDHLCQTAQPF